MSLLSEMLRLSEVLGISSDEQSFHNPTECCVQDFEDENFEHFNNLDRFLNKMSPLEKASLFHIAGYLTHKETPTLGKQQNCTVAHVAAIKGCL